LPAIEWDLQLEELVITGGIWQRKLMNALSFGLENEVLLKVNGF